LFFVTNHGARAVTVQIEAVDWRQQDNRDVFAPSGELFASPPLVRIAAGARQSVRILARPAGDGERSYRLLVTELSETELDTHGIHVLLQFSVPVFVRHDPHITPQLTFSTDTGRFLVTNTGIQTVKLPSLNLNGAAPGVPGPIYLLPGATRDLGAVKRGAIQVRTRDMRSGADISADLAQ
jgi:P pilus assembly chaperone PapD